MVKDSLLFQLTSAKFGIVLETGQSLARVDNAKILYSLTRDHGNLVVGDIEQS